MDLFGFEEDLELHNSEIASNTAVTKVVPQAVSPHDDTSKLTISQIQDLLTKDLANDTTTDVDTLQESDSSIFDETTSLPAPPKLRSRRNRAVQKKFEESSSVDTENTAESEFVIPVVKAYSKPNRKKKVLKSIENTHVNDASSSSKPKKINRKKGKAKLKNNENENVDNIAEEINNKFKEVENYKLVVE